MPLGVYFKYWMKILADLTMNNFEKSLKNVYLLIRISAISAVLRIRVPERALKSLNSYILDEENTPDHIA